MPDARTALLAFRIADRRFALDAARVAEVVRLPAVTRVPHGPPSLLGVTSLRGRVLPVIALERLLGVDLGNVSAQRLIVLRGGEPLGLAVEAVTGLEAGEGRGLVMTEGGAARIVPLEDMLQAAFAGAFRRVGAQRIAQPTRPAVVAAADVAVLAFSLAGQPYGLPLEHVREVVAPPAEVISLPHTDEAMLGVAALRGALTPIVSARVLLGLSPTPLTAQARVVVVSVGSARIGLVADDVSAIVRAPAAAVGPVPKVLNRGAGEARVTAMLRTGPGGLIALLEPERLFREASVAQILEDGHVGAPLEGAGVAVEAVERFVIFELGDETYGMEVATVEEVVALPGRLARVPRAPAYLLGVMNLRGATVPVVDQRQRFGVAAKAAASRPRVIVTRIGEMTAGFAVDAVTQILELPASRLSPAPELSAEAAKLFDRVAQVEDGGRVILLINPRELLDRAARDVVMAAAANATPS